MVTALLLKSSLLFDLSGGAWLFDSIIYQGEERPRPNQNLMLCSEFNADGTSHMVWFRQGEAGKCERWGTYTYDGTTLHEEVTHVNPDNAAECGRDPDMTTGHVTDTPAQITDANTFHLHLGVGDDELIYIWKRQESCPVPP